MKVLLMKTFITFIGSLLSTSRTSRLSVLRSLENRHNSCIPLQEDGLYSRMEVSQSESGNILDTLQLSALSGEYIQRERVYSEDRSRDSKPSLLNLNRIFTSKLEAIAKLRRIGEFIKSIFLPVGFPSSVPPEYFRFQSWNLLQDSCSYLRGIMSTQAILLGMGVGRSDPILSLLLAGDASIVDLVVGNSKPLHLPTRRVDNRSDHHSLLHLWHSPTSLLTKFTYAQLVQSLEIFRDEKYIILTENNRNTSTSTSHTYISFKKHCTAEDQAKGIFEAYLHGYATAIVGTDNTDTSTTTTTTALSVRSIVHHVFPIFWSVLKANRWNLDLVQLRPKGALVFEVS
eukprot:gene24815-32314_t